MTAQHPQSLYILAEGNGTEMLVGDGFTAETFDMDKIAFVVVGGIALAAHTAWPMHMEGSEIIINNFLG